MSPITLTQSSQGDFPARCFPPNKYDYNRTFERNICAGRIYNTDGYLAYNGNRTDPECLAYLFTNLVYTNNVTSTTVDTIALTYPGCQLFCGYKQGWYADAGPRVVIWIIPVVFLLSNIQLSSVDRRKLFAIIHALGDPIDSIWSLLDKLYAWYRCSQKAKTVAQARVEIQNRNRHAAELNDQNDEAEGAEEEQGPDGLAIQEAAEDQPDTDTEDLEHATRIIATVFSGLEELAGDIIESDAWYTTAAHTLGGIGSDNEHPDAFAAWRVAASTIADDRTNEFVRTGLAIVLYLFQVVSEFVTQISGDDQATPGGRIGSALLLSWLIPVTLLSNILGTFTSRRTCLETLMILVEATIREGDDLPADDDNDDPNDRLVVDVDAENESWSDYFNGLAARGAIYTYRPFKVQNLLRSSGREKVIRILMPITATSSIVTAFITAFIMHWKAIPEGFSCRHFWILGVFVAWSYSPIFTLSLHGRVSPSTHFWLVYAKDVIIGFTSVIIVFLSVTGLFNSCLCWTMSQRIKKIGLSFLLNRAQYYVWKEKLFPAVVGVSVFLQLLFVGVVVGLSWGGLIVSRWGEKHKRSEFENVHGAWNEQDINRFLFRRLARNR